MVEMCQEVQMKTIEEPLSTADQDLRNSEDRMLAERMKQGDEGALEKLFRRHAGILRIVASRIVYNDSDVDDLISELMHEVWGKIGDYDESKGNVLGWLITIMRRRAIDRGRRRQAYLSATDRFEIEVVQGERQHQRCDIGEVSDKDRHRRVLELLHGVKIPDAQRECLLLHYMENMSQRQIARHLRIPLGTVKTRIELGFAVIRTLVLTDKVFTPETDGT